MPASSGRRSEAHLVGQSIQDKNEAKMHGIANILTLKSIVHTILQWLLRLLLLISSATKHTWKSFCQWLFILKGRLHSTKIRVKNWFTNLLVVRKIDAAFPGWELGMAAAIGVAIFTFNLNLWFLVAAFITHKPRSNGLGTLWEGNCNAIDWTNKVLHGVINALSTILIAQSNFCMQLLASPTRLDIAAAHKRRQWVDIGMPSFRNVWNRNIDLKRTLLWVLLALGSVPLHLLWNSVIIFSPIAYQYLQLTVTEGFTHNMTISASDGLVQIEGSSEGSGAFWPDNLHILQKDLYNYERLENEDCKKKYAQHFILDRSDVVVVTKSASTETNTSTVMGGSSAGWGLWPYRWLCPPDARHNLACAGKLWDRGDDWIFPSYGGPKVAYCLSKKMPKKCRLEYGLLVTVCTVAANGIKLVCFLTTYWLLKRNAGGVVGNRHKNCRMQPLVTTGDAIASFLEFEDNETLGMSIVEKEDFENGIWDHRWVSINPMIWLSRFKCCRFRAIGIRRWLTGTILLFSIPLYPFVFLLTKIRWLKEDLGLDKRAIRDLGLGNPSGLFLFGLWNGNRQTDDSMSFIDQPTRGNILRSIALANTPQLILSVAFNIWYSHLTVMTVARDYNEFAAPASGSEDEDYKPKHGLRVTYLREGSQQRTAYFFAIPFKHWILVTILWTVLHWLASQAIFFARVDLLSHGLEVTEFSISQVGYSVLGIICFLGVASLIFLFGLGISVKGISNQMPLAATCSAALSAACHPRDPELKHHEKKVHWGVEIVDEDILQGGDQGVERCCFTSATAHYPIPGQLYA